MGDDRSSGEVVESVGTLQLRGISRSIERHYSVRSHSVLETILADPHATARALRACADFAGSNRLWTLRQRSAERAFDALLRAGCRQPAPYRELAAIATGSIVARASGIGRLPGQIERALSWTMKRRAAVPPPLRAPVFDEIDELLTGVRSLIEDMPTVPTASLHLGLDRIGRSDLAPQLPGHEGGRAQRSRVDARRVLLQSDPRWFAWILDDYSIDRAGQMSKTYVGELIYQAKYRADAQAFVKLTTAVSEELLTLLQWDLAGRTFAGLTSIVAVPCNPPKRMSIPHAIARAAASLLGLPDRSSDVVKVLETPTAKLYPRHQPEAYRVDGQFRGERVLLVDDVFNTGSTLKSVADPLRRAGAADLVGLCIARAHKKVRA